MTRTVCLIALVVLCAGCGDEPAPPKRVELPLPELEPVSSEQRVRYALERLERGPKPLGPLRVPEIHRRNLELAEDDLIALEREAQKQLAEPARLERITGMARRNADPWHNVLRVLLGMEKRPADLVLAWTRPVLRAPAGLVTLRLEAARLLSTIDDEGAAAILLELFRLHAGIRELSTVAFSALLRYPGETRAAALEIALRHGPPSLWADAWTRIARLVPPGEMDPELADVMAWWCALIVGSGPRMPVTLPHLKSHPWTQARLAVDTAVPGRADGKRGSLVFGPISSTITHGSGWYASDLSEQPVFPLYGYVFSGKLPAAEGRCVLGRWGFGAYAAAVDADLLLKDVDEGLYYAAKHCMLRPVTSDDEAAARELTLELDRGGPWDVDRVRRVQRLLGSFMSCDDAGVWTLMERVLFGMRPLDACRPAIEQAYDAMRSRPQDLTPLVIGHLEGDDEEARGIALHLVRRARDPVYLDALERRLDATQDPQGRGALRRTLAFIYTRGYGIEPRRHASFVERYGRWLEASDDREFAALATGLLDLEEAGERAFAQGLRGPKRALFLAAWPRGRRIVPPDVAEAAVEPMGPDTAPGELARMMGRAYYSFPAESVGVLEALRRRLPPEVRPFVAPVLERVSHRAPFRRRVK